MKSSIACAIAASSISLLIALPALAGTSFGAGAANEQTGAVALSYEHASQTEAEQAALAACGAGCTIKMRFSNRQCAAAATDSKNNAYGFGIGSSETRAKGIAKSECRGRGGKCAVTDSACMP